MNTTMVNPLLLGVNVTGNQVVSLAKSINGYVQDLKKSKHWAVFQYREGPKESCPGDINTYK